MRKAAKKVIIEVLIVLIVMFICWRIGQTIKSNGAQNDSDVEKLAEKDKSETSKWEKYVIFEGSTQTKDTPWGYTAGWIELDKNKNVMVLLPNTSAQISNLSNELIIEYQIHPWVASLSDGAGLKIQVFNVSGDIIREERVIVDNSMSWIQTVLDVSKAKYVRVLVDSGETLDENADWIVVNIL